MLQVALAGIMAALVAVATFLVQIPIPATNGYLNFGDIMIFVSALMFGPVVGGLAGSIGSALSDVIGGYGSFVPFTFVIKGAEGAIAGFISNRVSVRRDVLAVLFAGLEMVTGYFLCRILPSPVWMGSYRRSALQHTPGRCWSRRRYSDNFGSSKAASRSVEKVEPPRAQNVRHC